jgi:hypothetical protein
MILLPTNIKLKDVPGTTDKSFKETIEPKKIS